MTAIGTGVVYLLQVASGLFMQQRFSGAQSVRSMAICLNFCHEAIYPFGKGCHTLAWPECEVIEDMNGIKRVPYASLSAGFHLSLN